MRRYDDPVDVRRGRVSGTGGGPVEGPEQFLWRGRLWKVHQVVAQWVETGPWWQSRGVHAVLGDESAADLDLDRATGGGDRTRTAVRPDLAAEREVWRVEAGRGMAAAVRGTRPGGGPGDGRGDGRGVFDLVFDWADGSWRLTRCLD